MPVMPLPVLETTIVLLIEAIALVSSMMPPPLEVALFPASVLFQTLVVPNTSKPPPEAAWF